MFLGRLIGCITLLVSLQAQALPTTTLPPEQHVALGKQLATHAGASQWQQLWQRSRQAGHLSAQTSTAYFSIDAKQLIEATKLTLSAPDQTSSDKQTQIFYRRDFAPQLVGKQAGVDLSAVCLWVDWRTLPEHALNRPAPYLGQISLLLTRPCH